MTSYISAETRRTDREALADADRSVRSLRQTFPAWVCWYGSATRRWWGLPSPNSRSPALIEAATAEDLALRIRRMSAAESCVSINRTAGHYRRDLA